MSRQLVTGNEAEGPNTGSSDVSGQLVTGNETECPNTGSSDVSGQLVTGNETECPDTGSSDVSGQLVIGNETECPNTGSSDVSGQLVTGNETECPDTGSSDVSGQLVTGNGNECPDTGSKLFPLDSIKSRELFPEDNFKDTSTGSDNKSITEKTLTEVDISLNDASQGDTNPDGDSKEDDKNKGDTNPDGDSKEDDIEENRIAETKPEVVTKPLKCKIIHKPGKPITSLSHTAKACKHKALSGKGDRNEPQTGMNDDSLTGDSGIGDGQVTITVHSNVKGVIGGIKEKFSEYKKTLKPSLQLTCTPVVSMMNLGTNSKYNIVTPSKVVKTSKEEDPMPTTPTPKLTMTSSVTGRESINTKCRVKIYVDENTILE